MDELIKLENGKNLRKGDILRVLMNTEIIDMIVSYKTDITFTLEGIDKFNVLKFYVHSLYLVEPKKYPVKIFGVLLNPNIWEFKGYLPFSRSEPDKGKYANFITNDGRSVVGCLQRDGKVFTKLGSMELSEFKYFKYVDIAQKSAFA